MEEYTLEDYLKKYDDKYLKTIKDFRYDARTNSYPGYHQVSLRKLTSLKGIEKLINLNNLTIRECDIKNIGNIEKLTKLTHLTISNNKLTTLKGIENLTNLKSLDVNNSNKLTSLKGIENLTNLESLYFSNSNIKLLNYVNNLKKLTHISFHNTPAYDKIFLDNNNMNFLKMVSKKNNRKSKIDNIIK